MTELEVLIDSENARLVYHVDTKIVHHEFRRFVFGTALRTVLERGVAGYAFASGMAATTSLTHLLLKQGDHAICSDNVYGGTFRLFDKVLSRYGLEFTYVNVADTDAVREAIRPNTKMIWLETPTNPLLALADIPAIAALKPSGALLGVDNTFA